MPKKVIKTNAMRILDSERVEYACESYEVDESDLSGEHIASELGLDPARVFKTLVLHGDKSGYIVCCLPVALTVDLKSLARVSGNKSVEMIHVNELLGLTGYIRGGCSPVGMKKHFPTYFHSTVNNFDRIYLSGGRRGLQLIVAPTDILRVTGAVVAEVAI